MLSPAIVTAQEKPRKEEVIIEPRKDNGAVGTDRINYVPHTRYTIK